LLRNAQKRDKKIEQNNRGLNKKNGGKKSHIFCDEPRWTSSKKVLIAFLNSPCYETPKTRLKKIDKKTLFFFRGCGKCTSLSSLFFSRPPLFYGAPPLGLGSSWRWTA
jgi:hypothetical protein